MQDKADLSSRIKAPAWRQKPIESQSKADFRRGESREAALRGRLAGTMIALMKEFTIKPDPEDPRLVRRVSGVDQDGKAVETSVVMERPLTLYLNGQEIVTMMTIGDHPNYLAAGYLLNQNMLRADDVVTGIDYHDDLATAGLPPGMGAKPVRLLTPTVVPPSASQPGGVDLARRAGLSLIGGARGRRFLAFAGGGRILYDAGAADVAEEEKRSRRKASLEE